MKTCAFAHVRCVKKRIPCPVGAGDSFFILAEDGFVYLCAVLPVGAEPYLLHAGVKVVDFSADFRLRDAATYEEWYKGTHSQRAPL